MNLEGENACVRRCDGWCPPGRCKAAEQSSDQRKLVADGIALPPMTEDQVAYVRNLQLACEMPVDDPRRNVLIGGIKP